MDISVLAEQRGMTEEEFVQFCVFSLERLPDEIQTKMLQTYLTFKEIDSTLQEEFQLPHAC